MSVTVCVTGAAGQIAYSLLPLLCSGRTFGPNTRVRLQLLDIDKAMEALGGVKMELEDAVFPLLDDVMLTTDPKAALSGCDVAIMLGAFPRLQGMERKDLLEKNCGIFSAAGKTLEEVASKNVKVLVVGNPANTNCSVMQQCAPSIPKENFSALTRLDHNRVLGQIAIKSGVSCDAVKNTTIWGNHSSTQFPDVSHGTVVKGGSSIPVTEAVNDDAYLKGSFIETIQKRGAAIINARKLSSAMSAAAAISDHMKDWISGTKEGEHVSMAVVSDGSYGITEGIVYSFPVTCKDGKYSIVQGLPVSDFAREKMNITLKELEDERDMARQFI